MEIVVTGHQILAIYYLYLLYVVVFCSFMFYGLIQLMLNRSDRIPAFMVCRAVGLKRGAVQPFVVLHVFVMLFAFVSTCLMTKYTGSPMYLFYHVSLLIASIVTEALFITTFLTVQYEQTKD